MSGREITDITGGVAHPSMTEDFIVADEVLSIVGTHHTRRSGSSCPSGRSVRGFRAGVGLKNVARRTLGIILLLATVVLWTGSNFLASVSYSYGNYCFLTNSNLSQFLPTTHIQSRTSLRTSIRHSLPYHYFLYFSKSPIIVATVRSSHQQSAIGKAA